ncbi:UDP-N-acetylglucosamine--N-acetylmuramyl-(pentapeptide) pyrophosphoryl-undecaprenol N-acetylglucosamine transferase [Streptomyces sp. IMTB 2501]|uniref:UDP-N-acetylglucosamine--N-acetylmuramyl- (pentapeptide) pyrophosphoryl-undecaprenol N-acetylglucosamine transferase n=1 Tax=Streptomyces sp. IMTB 2501 TaxID=1776340 RepID=UPI00096DA22D|nr:UDP-N-acetylglucosamine--N-acetylmuramyl-(pentapeptide) pyrophosphoryl-undecaprenol N-acetylglucosamine transferase [Streptomyces sp. IMTB 2501]OLZ74647.1 UDP-N-acetylglucosamine--N-acetylmuramyl-(pentapeptide) pyrophosphoryl-undecaprenol N-acetylglucosamine transferase [Streptomyces sp. IMTB 2501]
MDISLSVVIGAGGTGGHIYPGLALADALRRRVPDAVISFVGTERGLETRLIPGAGYRLHTVDMIPYDRSLGARRFTLPAALLKSAGQCRTILRDQRAHIAVGMGGYPSAPVILGARLAGLPSLIHESNAVPGRANAFAARLTPHVALAFEAGGAQLPASCRPELVGMPLSGPLAALDRDAERAHARRALGIPPHTRLLLVNGGSLGAARLTEAALGIAERWRDRTDVRVLIKTGPTGLDAARARLTATGADRVADAVAYLDRIDLTYAAADLVVCRAGSATVAELATIGLPAVLVPYPHAPGDHQTHNARALTGIGAGVLLRDEDTTAGSLEAVAGSLLDDPVRLHAMSRAAATAGVGTHHRTAADRLAAKVLQLAGHPLPTPLSAAL